MNLVKLIIPTLCCPYRLYSRWRFDIELEVSTVIKSDNAKSATLYGSFASRNRYNICYTVEALDLIFYSIPIELRVKTNLNYYITLINISNKATIY